MKQSDAAAFGKSGFFTLNTANFHKTENANRPFQDTGTDCPTCV